MEEQNILAVLGENIKQYRSRSGWSQIDLAEKINISIPFLSNIEQGKTWVSSSTLAKFTRAFDVNVYDLFKPDRRLPDRQTRLLRKYLVDAHDQLDRLARKYLN
ncbi:MAG: helix-turn-helix domain-containing protein [Candidatus Margulisbacteria bacterium]|jgi:transcriptional regulator with XRE-family HTH domain|nr:helix-turn-helix domain-containing protein [Candidatus Margulisiibacteriota bacterium]